MLAGITCNSCLVYLDDIAVDEKAMEEHFWRLAEVLHLLQSVGLKTSSEERQMPEKASENVFEDQKLLLIFI
ncbi:hypothetical protein T07_13141 [Trichinella nelsoni]|uniref:Uncharacterized protein n=1 Tax=Trichinella nelsoni TaxID=6336 RepID=A0A0V0SFZ7_9BILA|nr:hypothetical protein T07_13141 [Trichinella nelsoni]